MYTKLLLQYTAGFFYVNFISKSKFSKQKLDYSYSYTYSYSANLMEKMLFFNFVWNETTILLVRYPKNINYNEFSLQVCISVLIYYSKKLWFMPAKIKFLNIFVFFSYFWRFSNKQSPLQAKFIIKILIN